MFSMRQQILEPIQSVQQLQRGNSHSHWLLTVQSNAFCQTTRLQGNSTFGHSLFARRAKMFTISFIFVILPINSSNPLASKCPAINKSLAMVRNCEASYVQLARAFLPISLLALVINACSFLHFARPRRRRRSLMSLNLALLSCSEVLLHVFLTADYVGLLTGVCRYPFEAISRRPQLLLASAASLLVDAFLCARNWCHVIISSARAEVVLRPFRTRTFLNQSVALRAYFVILGLALSASALRAFAEQLVVCQNDDEEALAVLVDLWLQSWLFQVFDDYIFFTIQTLGPVLFVVTSSLTIALKMLPWYHGDRDTEHPALAALNESDAKPGTATRRKNHARATRTVLLLATIFAAMEMPTLVSVMLTKTTEWLDGPRARHVATAVCEAAILVDSVLNLVVFSTGQPPRCCGGRNEKFPVVKGPVVRRREKGRKREAKGGEVGLREACVLREMRFGSEERNKAAF